MNKNILLDDNKREYPEHLLQGFPVGVVENKFSLETYNAINWHWHDELQYTLVTKGEFLFKVGNQEIILKEGEGLFINTQKIHNSHSLKDNSSYLFVYFHPTLIPYEKNTYLFKKYVSPILKNKNLSAIKLTNNFEESKNIFDIILYGFSSIVNPQFLSKSHPSRKAILLCLRKQRLYKNSVCQIPFQQNIGRVDRELFVTI